MQNALPARAQDLLLERRDDRPHCIGLAAQLDFGDAQRQGADPKRFAGPDARLPPRADHLSRAVSCPPTSVR